MGDEMFTTDRWYGTRYAESAGEDLYRVAGRILSDLKADQATGAMPPSAVFVVVVVGSNLTVQVHVQDVTDFADLGAESIRAQASRICERYNWRHKEHRTRVRFSYSCQVRTVRGRLDASQLGSLLAW